MAEQELRDQVAAVIGGSEGIGETVAHSLAAAGARVAIISRNADKADKVLASIRADGGEACWFQGDFMVSDDMLRVADEIRKVLGNCSILVAGGGPGHPRPKPFLDTPLADYESFFLSRCIGRLFSVRAFAPQMIALGRGKMVLLTTDAGRVPTKSEVLNGAAAAALVFATRALAHELTHLGIRVNAVSTTLTTETPSFDRFRRKMESNWPDAIARVFAKIQSKTPLGSLNTPDDVAKAVLFFAGQDSDRISGAVLSVNGGLSTP